ncbi:MAG TPA: hypothetical protein VMA35_07385 [Candidatus Sulfopaludibacter sp.]|nr:hypothetical protein [Candidatus Sulfopaludibacter sp.]
MFFIEAFAPPPGFHLFAGHRARFLVVEGVLALVVPGGSENGFSGERNLCGIQPKAFPGSAGAASPIISRYLPLLRSFIIWRFAAIKIALVRSFILNLAIE